MRPLPELRVEWLEHRTLLSGTGHGILAGASPRPSATGIPTTGSLAAGEIVFYQVDPTTEGTLTAELQSGDDDMRLSLLNGRDQLLGAGRRPVAPPTPRRLICPVRPGGARRHLEVENLGLASLHHMP